MSESTLEQRVRELEKRVAELSALVDIPRSDKSWRNLVGRFPGDDVMKEIQEEGRRIREAERRQIDE